MTEQNKSAKDKFTPVSDSARKKENSGVPGGGAGRVEEAGGSGVYPASGPLPKDNASYQGEMSFGQGKRGEAGYNDSGDSEVSMPGQSNASPSGRAQREIPRDQWVSFFDSFSREHEGWLADLNVTQDGQQNRAEVHNLPFQSVAASLKHGDQDTISIIFATETQPMVTHSLSRVRQVMLTRTGQGADAGLVLQSVDGSKATLQFRSPAVGGTVDGVPTQKGK